MSDVAEAYPTQKVVTCNVCGGSDSVPWFCKNCPGSLCDLCKESHKTTAISRKHSVVPRTQTVVRTHGPAKIAEQCPRHKGKDISTYCIGCKVACCVNCLAENHQSHMFCPIEEIYLEKEQGLNVYIKTLEVDVKTSLNKLMNEAKQDTHADEERITKTIRDVNEFRKEMKDAVDIQCDALIDTLQKPNIDRNSFISLLQKQNQRVDQLVRGCKEKIWEGKLDLIEYNPPSPSSLIPCYDRPLPQIPIFDPEKKALNFIRNGIGKLKYFNREKEGSTASGSVSNVFDKSLLHVTKVNAFKRNIGVTAIAMAGNGRAWVAHHLSDTIYLYDAGKMIASLVVKKGVCIHAMFVEKSEQFTVTNADNKVRRVSVDGTVTTLIDTAPFSADGVFLTETGQIMICMRGKQEQNHVAIYSPDGKTKVSEIKGRDAKGKRWLTDPYRALQNGQYYCFINIGTNVVTFDQSGSLLWVYDGTQAKLKEKFHPVGVCCDKYINLLVSDVNNHCVHYLNFEGRLIQVILTEEQIGLKQHWGMDVDNETGQVWVGNPSANLVIAKYLK